MKNLFNLIGFQVCWWLCILGVRFQFPFLGPVCMVVFLLIHCFGFRVEKSELKLILLVSLIGTLIDSMLAYSGIVEYEGTYSSLEWLAPLWITAMWAGFASTVNHSLAWLKERPFITITMGFIAGPVAYLTAEKFGAITMNGSAVMKNSLLAIIWGSSVRAIFIFNKRLRISSNTLEE